MELTGGTNIALKVPPHQWDATVAFYRDVVGIAPLADPGSDPPSAGFRFGANRQWVDRVAGVSQAEIRLQLTTPDPAAAARHLDAHGVVRCDAIEALPEGSDGFWISSPAAVVHLVSS